MKVIYSGMLYLTRQSKTIVWRMSTKLVFSAFIGKILQDDKTVESYNIQEKDFLVCLPSKV